METKRVPGEVRRAQILELVQERRSVSVADLVQHFHVSPITISRDLDRLQKSGLLARVHGGAVTHELADPQPAESGRIETEWAKRSAHAVAEKRAIAEYAMRWVKDGSTIFVDHSTTGLALARAIEQEPLASLTLVTNSPALASSFRSENVHVIVICGELDQTVKAIGGSWTVEFLQRLNFQVAFISAAAVTLENGLMTSRPMLADTLKAVHAVSASTVALIDSSKFEKSALFSFVQLDELAGVVTDDGLPPSERQRYLEAGVHLHITGEPAQQMEASTGRSASGSN